ncbi:MAG: hypothetical protein HYY04_16985 [Chloroflexi bacterium]|nr:hypothetical protein [Chloroflexota bacterium]
MGNKDIRKDKKKPKKVEKVATAQQGLRELHQPMIAEVVQRKRKGRDEQDEKEG